MALENILFSSASRKENCTHCFVFITYLEQQHCQQLYEIILHFKSPENLTLHVSCSQSPTFRFMAEI